MSTTYRCSVCHTTSVHDGHPDYAACNETDACGLLFDDEIVKPVEAPTARSLRFELFGLPADYAPGDDRPYSVLHRGLVIGVVEPGWAPAAKRDGEPVRCWDFSGKGRDGVQRIGQGSTRAKAVAAAFEVR